MSEILMYARILPIPYFRGVFMRDTLPTYPLFKESMVVNLDSARNRGTHWVCSYKENDDTVEYFDSFGLEPPSEMISYWHRRNPSIRIIYNSEQSQAIDDNICGHLCLYFFSR